MGQKKQNSMTAAWIVSAAMEYADENGIEALTMRKLAAVVKSAPMTMYYHIDSREKLIDQMVERVFAEIDLPSEGADWRSAIRSRCLSARAVLNRHPWAAPLMESRSNPGPESLGHHNAVIGCFRRAGFPMSLVAHAYAILDSFIYGFAFEEAVLPGDTQEAYAPIAEQIAEQIAVGGFNDLAAFTREHVLKSDYRFGSSFEFGLDLILDGLSQALEREREPR